VTRDYLCDVGSDITVSPLQRACHLLPWSHDDHMMLDDPKWQELPQCIVPPVNERCNETLPDPSLPLVPSAPPFTVFTDIKLVKSYLTHPSFKLTRERETADIVWICEHFKEFGSMKPGQFINQFGCENVLTCKDLLVETAKRACHSGTSPQGLARWAGPGWLPETYNLLYELPLLVWNYRQMERGYHYLEL
jgi:tubulin--tyrosine ligase-like protein 12